MFSVIAYDGQVYGPVDVNTLITWCQQGRIVSGTHLVETATGRSFLAADMPELQAMLAHAQAAAPQAHQGPMGQPTQVHNRYQPQGQYPTQNPYQTQSPYPPQNPYQQQSSFPSGFPSFGGYGGTKSRSAALLWCFFLGGLGAHRFYLGHTVSAVAMLVVGLIATTGFCPFIVISLIWSTIDFIRILQGNMPDSQGIVPR